MYAHVGGFGSMDVASVTAGNIRFSLAKFTYSRVACERRLSCALHPRHHTS